MTMLSALRAKKLMNVKPVRLPLKRHSERNSSMFQIFCGRHALTSHSWADEAIADASVCHTRL